MSGDIAWPPSSGLTTKIVPREKAVLQMSYSTVVHSPAALVFDTVRIGSIMTFDVVMDPKKSNKINHTPLKVVDICTPSAPTSYISPEMLEDPTFTADLSKVYRVSWTGHGGLSSLGMSLERFHEVIVLGENDCEVRTWEVMSGPLARIVKMMFQDTLKEKVALWCEDLKKRCERLAEG
jgi:hypothetical protein